MKFFSTLMLLITVGTHGAFAQALPQGDIWRAFAQTIEVGTRVKVRLLDGQRVTATLIQADPGELLLQPRTRIPVPVQRITYDRIASLERDNARGVRAGTAAAIGVASGAGAFLAILLILMATID